MPLVLQSVPSATLTIVGRNAVDEIRALGQLPGITLCLDVEATVPFLQAARVALVPIRVGAGTRLKALEAMAVGRPIVGTTIGLAGLDIVEGVHARIADTTGSFASAIVDLLNDDEASDRLAREGRALVERRYSWDRIGEGYADLIDGLR
jgi:glycosyltransferase involved in cell wall biosynthesis